LLPFPVSKLSVPHQIGSVAGLLLGLLWRTASESPIRKAHGEPFLIRWGFYGRHKKVRPVKVRHPYRNIIKIFNI